MHITNGFTDSPLCIHTPGLHPQYFLVTVGYTVVAATGMVYIAKWIGQAQGMQEGSYPHSLWMMVVIFSGLQV